MRRDHGALDLPHDSPNRLDLFVRGRRGAGVDGMDSRFRQRFRHGHLLIGIEPDPGHLFPVAQRRIRQEHVLPALVMPDDRALKLAQHGA